MRTAKQDELAEKHGTPEQFEKAIWKAYSDLFISHEEATSAIRRYQTEWDDASTGYAANARNEELHDQCCDEMACPFCGETNFDATGLKIHLLAGHCKEFNAVSTDVPRTRETNAEPEPRRACEP
jgi:hypothetical protein